MLKYLLQYSKYLIFLAVLGIFVLALASLAVGCHKSFYVVKTLFVEGMPPKGDKTYLLGFIEIVDIFLLATVFYIIALGLYELFIDDQIILPDWLKIKNLDDLKIKLITVVIVTLGVLFLGRIISWDGESELMGLGVSIGAVVAALAYFSNKKKEK
ncbi:MAG: YqhA family protein [Bacteroidota bacterium]